MSEFTVTYQFEQEQYFLCIDEFLDLDEVYCPMCEDFHENNTNCQRGY